MHAELEGHNIEGGLGKASGREGLCEGLSIAVKSSEGRVESWPAERFPSCAGLVDGDCRDVW
jgi:hypothetical protein